MSLINKILSGLSRRKADAPLEKAPSSVAAAPKSRVRVALLGVLICALAGGAGWAWWSSRQKIPAPTNVAQSPAKPISAPQTASAPAALPNASGGEIAQVVAASAPVVSIKQEASPKENVSADNGREMKVAALGREQEPEVLQPTYAPAKPPVATKKSKHRKFPSFSGAETAAEASAVEVGMPRVPEGGVDKQIKPLSVQQQADNEFRKANGLLQQGHVDEALAGYEAALQLDADHDAARQALAILLLQNKRNADAEHVLQDGLKRNIKHSGFAMLLARIQLERDASWSALLTLQKTLPYAERKADYRAFVAALLQRLERHREAVAHFQAAVQLSPNSGVWWMGLGISLKATQRNEEARAAFKRAMDTNTLNADLQAFVAQQLREL